MPFPECPDFQPDSDLVRILLDWGQSWAADRRRPSPEASVSEQWTRLINEWAHTTDLPLLIRSSKGSRGAALVHDTGRIIVCTDNSPAQCAFEKACAGDRPTLDDIREVLRNDKLPVALALKAAERRVARYQCTLSQAVTVNTRGWKLGHLDAVGIGRCDALQSAELSRLQFHFLRLMSPANQFVIPLQWAGLAEIEEVRRAFRAT